MSNIDIIDICVRSAKKSNIYYFNETNYIGHIKIRQNENNLIEKKNQHNKYTCIHYKLAVQK